jgi:hypothetical protein
MTPIELVELRGRYVFARTVLATAREATTAVLTDGPWEFDWRHSHLFNDRTAVASGVAQEHGRWLASYGPTFTGHLLDVVSATLDLHEVDEQGDCKRCWVLSGGKAHGPCPDALRILDLLAPASTGEPS